jgi:GxxExxY protein
MKGCAVVRAGDQDRRVRFQGRQRARAWVVEKVYENALAHEIRKSGFGVIQQRAIVVFYDDVIVGEYTADLMVEEQVIVELNVVGALSDAHVPQRRNDLRAAGKPLCLLINFGQCEVEVRRITVQA